MNANALERAVPRTGAWLGFLLIGFSCLGPARTEASEAESDPGLFLPLVEEVRQINGRGFPSAVLGESEAWQVIVMGDEDTGPPPTDFALARRYEQGRVIAIGHESMLTTENIALLDNGRFMRNVVRWLDSAQTHHVLYTTGHKEQIGGGSLEGLRAVLADTPYTFSPLTQPVTASALLPGAVLIVGHAQGTFAPEEIEAIRQFVAEGGGLLLAAQGWSWQPYVGRPLDEFPMNQLGIPYEVRWLGTNLSDPTDHIGGAVVFHVLYPDPRTLARTLSGAMSVIEDAHAVHPADLMAALEQDTGLRQGVVVAHTFLADIRAFPLDHPWRPAVFDFYLGLMEAFPEHYARLAPFDEVQFPTSTWLRERVWRTVRDCLPLTPEQQTQVAAAGRLTGRYRDLWQTFGLVVLDNLKLNSVQTEFLYQYLSRVPRKLHDLRAISVMDFLGRAPAGLSLEGEPGAVNIAGVPIGPGGYSENSFPHDVSPGFVDGFSIIVAHEVNHVVDVHAVRRSTALSARRDQLVQQAGGDPVNYLRGGAGLGTTQGFFVDNPQEFFASIANQWFTDSLKTIDLGIARFQAGRKEPINQALFFAEVYARGGDSSYFYAMGTNGVIKRSTVPLKRDARGHIKALHIDGESYRFERDAAGNVLAVDVGVGPPDLETLVDFVKALGSTAFNARGQRPAMLSILADIRDRINSCDESSAAHKLENLRRRVDGCHGSFTQLPNRNDWIVDCPTQHHVRSLIDELLRMLIDYRLGAISEAEETYRQTPLVPWAVRGPRLMPSGHPKQAPKTHPKADLRALPQTKTSRYQPDAGVRPQRIS